MCYSKEVQLITAGIIIIVSLFYYFVYRKQYSKKTWLKSFLDYVILGFLAIGVHQLFEFIALVTENQIIYKFGLLISISSIYFFMRSLEVMTNKRFGSKLFLVVITLVGIHMFLIPMKFEAFSFYLRAYSNSVWAKAWLLLFIYWNICGFLSIKSLDKQKRTILFYLLATLDVSFILSLIYVLVGNVYFSVDSCFDSPSIWCTFFVVQTLFLPFFLSTFQKNFKRPGKLTKVPIKTILLISFAAILILVTISYFSSSQCLVLPLLSIQ